MCSVRPFISPEPLRPHGFTASRENEDRLGCFGLCSQGVVGSQEETAKCKLVGESWLCRGPGQEAALRGRTQPHSQPCSCCSPATDNGCYRSPSFTLGALVAGAPQSALVTACLGRTSACLLAFSLGCVGGSLGPVQMESDRGFESGPH